MKTTKIGLLALMSGFLSLSAGHAVAAFPPPQGWYIEGNIGESNQSNINYGFGTKTSTSNAGLGLNANLGYKFFPYFALEGGYTRYSRMEIQYGNTTVAKNDPSTWDITTKAILPIQDSGFSFYAKVGIARTTASIVINNQAVINEHGLDVSSGDSSATGLLYGIGGEYYFLKNTAVHVSWVEALGNNNTGDMAFTSIGLSYLIG